MGAGARGEDGRCERGANGGGEVRRHREKKKRGKEGGGQEGRRHRRALLLSSTTYRPKWERRAGVPWGKAPQSPPILQVQVLQGDATSVFLDLPSRSSTPLFPLPTWWIHPSDRPGTPLHFDARVAEEHERSSESGPFPPKRKSDDGGRKWGRGEVIQESVVSPRSRVMRGGGPGGYSIVHREEGREEEESGGRLDT